MWKHNWAESVFNVTSQGKKKCHAGCDISAHGKCAKSHVYMWETSGKHASTVYKKSSLWKASFQKMLVFENIGMCFLKWSEYEADKTTAVLRYCPVTQTCRSSKHL